MKRLLTITLICIACTLCTNCWCQLFVSPVGSDAAPGTESAPFATVGKALREVRELRRLQDPLVKNGVHIFLKDGLYKLDETIYIRSEDAGTPQSPTFIEAAPNARPVISGGVAINGWHKVKSSINGLTSKSNGKVWVADVPASTGQLFNFRQLWVNGVKAVRAKSPMNRILGWNKKDGTCWIPTPKNISSQNISGLEMFIHQWWEIATLRIRKFEVHGDSTLLSFLQPESKIQNEHPWPAPWISKETGNSAFYLTNSIQLLDEPGEWYLDVNNHKIYYWPTNSEDMLHADVMAPYVETLITIEGTAEKPVSNIQFKGIAFEHTGWLRPSEQGHVPHQVGMYMLEAYKLKTPGTAYHPKLDNQAWVGRLAAAVSVSYSTQVNFENCVFQHLAAAGLDYAKGTIDNTVKGNLFTDIGGTGIQAGWFSDRSTEIHIPYDPSNEKEICTNLEIADNLITNATNEDWGCAGIAAGYVRNISIHHNEIAEVNYTGISLGWGWTAKTNAMKNNHVFANKIHHYAKHMYDVAGIYTQSAQPGSIVEENYIDSIYKAPYAHLPSHWFYLYTDEGTSYVAVKNNWTPSAKFLQNANGPGNTWENNGPQVTTRIKENAGIQPQYQYLLKYKQSSDKNYAINKEQPVIIELIADAKSISIEKLKQVLAKNDVAEDGLYHWQDHFVIFDKVRDVLVLQQNLLAAFPLAQVKTYNDLFYEFNRTHCSDTTSAKKWSHTILTANMVADTKLQQEYLQYHATQFEKWPEVSNGFCNASFQQLLLFKNGKQLMLVISVPENESLDKLNPKTVENNPRVNEWNALMKKYQEGIAGTKKGEVWVQLEKMNTLK
ncbi:MAG: L-rhamnose mutarotase [Bacteroidota bacterium]